MFLFDLKDFRRAKFVPVEVTEEGVLAAMEECGIEFKTPLSLRCRIKDFDPRGIMVRSDLVDNVGDEFRLNIYVPAGFKDETNKERFLTAVNAQIRHQLTHIAQARQPDGLTEKTVEEWEPLEVEAQTNALSGSCDVITIKS